MNEELCNTNKGTPYRHGHAPSQPARGPGSGLGPRAVGVPPLRPAPASRIGRRRAGRPDATRPRRLPEPEHDLRCPGPPR
ncbi:hypothetical protein LI90_1824 [Carbonactinospora thermoautotrophica]|uniref:Uncharacterized protein n=1 Tax=Carbonactinospora thermoautotrophica TaxID=1469144 RepID=A0A132MSI5_9ACTN|nr:hypothetical protein LI90_1824 [Carbonactinospora thermoautotrophica]